MLHRLRDLFLGSPLPTYEQAENHLNKIRALSAFSPDARSSIAYADQEINDGQQAMLILPEFVPAHWWQGFLHNQPAWLIKMALLY
jgi:hypothetical protein